MTHVVIGLSSGLTQEIIDIVDNGQLVTKYHF